MLNTFISLSIVREVMILSWKQSKSGDSMIIERKVTIFLLLLTLTTLLMQPMIGIAGLSMGKIPNITPAQNRLIVYRAINTSELYANEETYLILSISNPTTWILENISFGMIIPQNVKVIHAMNENDSKLVQSSLRETLRGTNISVKIAQIGMNSTFHYWVKIMFKDKGSYTFDAFKIYFIRVKGEIREEASITCPALVVDVKGIEYKKPPEGSITADPYLLIILVIMPLGVAMSAHKIVAGEKEEKV